MRSATTWPIVAALLFAGCGEDAIVGQRADSGVHSPDTGISDPLFFQPGMRFKYRAMLTHRSRPVGGMERNAIYEMVIRIAAVDDQGSSGQSALTVTATGAQVFDQNWDITAGGDSWVAAAGPAERDDQVAAGNIRIPLGNPPSRPEVGETLPPDDLFFLDMRKQESIRTTFFDRYGSIGARFVSPEMEPLMRWVLLVEGEDPSMDFYPAGSKKRMLSLAYDPRGFLKEIRETLGDAQIANSPNASFTLTLVEGP